MPAIIAAAGSFVFRINEGCRVPAPFARAAMQRYSWTNNPIPLVFRGPLPGRFVQTEFESENGRRSSRTAANEDGRIAAHAGRDCDRALGQSLPYVRAADAVSVFEGAAGRRLHRAWLRADCVRRDIRPDVGAAGLPCRS